MKLLAGVRERNRLRKREAIINAATELFLENGFEQTTVEAVAERAGVSRRTFFRYFQTKEALLFPRTEERLRRLQELLAEAHPSVPPFQAFRRAALLLAHDYIERKDELLQQKRIIESSPQLAAIDMRVDQEWEHAIAETFRGETNGERYSESKIQILAGCLVGTIRATLRLWIQRECKPDLLALGEEAFDLIEGGVGVFLGGHEATPNPPEDNE